MKIKIYEIQNLAKKAAQNLKDAKRVHKNIEGTEDPGCSMSHDIGYWAGYLKALGNVYNLRTKK